MPWYVVAEDEAAETATPHAARECQAVAGGYALRGHAMRFIHSRKNGLTMRNSLAVLNTSPSVTSLSIARLADAALRTDAE